MKTCLIITGGTVNEAFAADYIRGRSYDAVIAVDAGLETARRLGIRPTAAVGDFDTVSRETLAFYEGQGDVEWEVHRPEKDETDTELALATAMHLGCTMAEVIGATGGRMDHTIANIHSMLPCLRHGMRVVLADEKNRMYLLDRGRVFRRSECFGRYISFLPLTDQVTGITLKGFKYPLTDRDIEIGPSLTISNELLGEEGSISFTGGILLCVEASD